MQLKQHLNFPSRLRSALYKCLAFIIALTEDKYGLFIGAIGAFEGYFQKNKKPCVSLRF